MVTAYVLYGLVMLSRASLSSSATRMTSPTIPERIITTGATMPQLPSQTQTLRNMAMARLTMDRGSSHCHPNSRIWSVLTLCRDALIQTKTANSSQALIRTQAMPGISEKSSSSPPPAMGSDSMVPWKGASQPPRKNSAKRRHAA